jgi:hypothetical protein
MVDFLLGLHLASFGTWLANGFITTINMTIFHLLSQILGLSHVLCEMQVQNYLNLIWIMSDIV